MTSRNPIGSNNSPNQRSAASSPDTETRKARTVKKPITSNKDDFMLQEQDIVPIMDNPQRQQLTTQRSIKKPIADSTISRPSMSNNSPSNGSYSNVSMNDNSNNFNSRNNTPSDAVAATTSVPRVRSIKNSKSTRKSEQLEMFDDDELPPPPSTPPPPSNYSPSSPTRVGSINKKNQRQQQQQQQQYQSNQDDEEEPVFGSTAADEIADEVGFTEQARLLMETPNQGSYRCLLPGESVVGEFEVLYPDDDPTLTRKIMCCLIFPFYGFYLLYKYCQHNRVCCLSPSRIWMYRGKLSITNKGRAICWGIESEQRKMKSVIVDYLFDCYMKLCCCFYFCTSYIQNCLCKDMCDSPFEFDTVINTRIFLLKDLRQITQWSKTSNSCPSACMNCCSEDCDCTDYEFGIDLGFHNFHNPFRLRGMVSYTVTENGIASWLQRVSALAGYFTGGIVRSVSSTEDVVRILSSTGDAMVRGDLSKSLDRISSLHNQILKCLPNTPDVFINNPLIWEDLKKNCTCDLSKDICDIQIVDDNQKVRVPRGFLPLLQGEAILAAHGDVYEMTFTDWFRSFYTCGLYYSSTIAAKKAYRTAIVITTKRIVVLDIYHANGVVPSNMLNYTVLVRSLFPGSIKAGYIRGYSSATMYESLCSLFCPGSCFPDPTRITSSIMCDAGTFTIDLSQRKGGLIFAKAMQMASTRVEKKVRLKMTRAKNADHCMSKQELEFVPMLHTETVLTRHSGININAPCCELGHLCTSLSNSFCRACYGAKAQTFLCNKRSLCFYPLCPMICTCGMRPFTKKSDYIITDQTIYYFDYKSNKPWIKCPAVEGETFVAWMPAQSLSSIDMKMTSWGKESCLRRCCKACAGENDCCKMCVIICCPMTKANYDIELGGAVSNRVDGMLHYTVSVESKKKSTWKDDEALLQTHSMLATIQHSIDAESRV